MEKTNGVKLVLVGIAAAVTAWLGDLAVPLYSLVALMILDYISALRVAAYRGQQVSSVKGIRGIEKKVFLLLLVVVGSFGDILLAEIGVQLPLHQPIAIAITLWLAVNESISILENIKDIVGERMPDWLAPLFRKIQSKLEYPGGDDLD